MRRIPAAVLLVALIALPVLGDSRTILTRRAFDAAYVNVTGDTFTGAALFSAGTASAPSLGFSADSDGSGSGIYRSAANTIAFTSNGAARAAITPTAFLVGGATAIATNTMEVVEDESTVGSLLALYDSRAVAIDVGGTALFGGKYVAAGTYQSFAMIQGAKENATDNNTAGYLSVWTRPHSGALTKRWTFGSTGALVATAAAGTSFQGAYQKTLTESSATAFVQIDVASNAIVAGEIHYVIEASDATDFQARAGVLIFTAVNKAGTETCTLGRPQGSTTVDNTTDIVAVSAGTLTNTFTCTTTPTNGILINANAVSSLTQTTLRINFAPPTITSGTTTVTGQ